MLSIKRTCSNATRRSCTSYGDIVANYCPVGCVANRNHSSFVYRCYWVCAKSYRRTKRCYVVVGAALVDIQLVGGAHTYVGVSRVSYPVMYLTAYAYISARNVPCPTANLFCKAFTKAYLVRIKPATLSTIPSAVSNQSGFRGYLRKGHTSTLAEGLICHQKHDPLSQTFWP